MVDMNEGPKIPIEGINPEFDTPTVTEPREMAPRKFCSWRVNW
jgi:hypothetical protein